MLDFIRLLKQRYQAIIAHTRDEAVRKLGLRDNLNSLILGEAFLKKGVLDTRHPDHAIQIAVIGPTQAGKSSLVNLLLREECAGVSPLAGYTVHPQGFCIGHDPFGGTWLNSYFEHYRRCAQEELPADRRDYYALRETEAAEGISLPPCIVWDTPDFDSVDAEGYRESVLRTAALADVIVLAVSRDKYADQSVWEMMALLEPLGQPTLIVLNKVTDETRGVIVESLGQKWREARDDKAPEIFTLSYHKEGALPDLCRQELAPLYNQLKKVCDNNRRRRHSRHEQAYLKAHWHGWIAPVAAEHNALSQWHQLVSKAVDDALALYRRDFLDHPQHYETFRLAIAELLTLLEIPGLAAALVQVRKIVTWPVRQLLRLGKGGRAPAETSNEISILAQAADHLMIRLAEAILDKCETEAEQLSWWKEIGAQLRCEKPRLTEAFRESARQYHSDFQPEIKRTAHRLYEKLQKQPVTLNGLRATRVTTDAAAVALALKTGGIGLHDLIITPAMLSITSLLTEGALGGYMSRVGAELKRLQFQTVEQELFAILKKALERLPEKMQGTDKFNIPKETVAAAEAKLKESRHGLRLL